MSEKIVNSRRVLPALKQINAEIAPTYDYLPSGDKRSEDSTKEEKFKLKRIVHKYRIQNLLNSFCSKIKRNRQHGKPAKFQLRSEQQKEEERWIKLKGIEIKRKWLQSLVFVGDIIFSLVIFSLAVLQAFLRDFQVQKSESNAILVIKMVAILFESFKIIFKCLKREVVNGIWMTYITDIIRYSTGIPQLLIYLTAIFAILISMLYPLDHSIGIFSFVIASLKLFKIPQNIKVLEIHYINSVRKQQYWDLFKVILFELFFGHFIAGLLLAMAELNSEKNWILVHGLDGQSWDELYYWAMYWSATLITTTGFGDFTATNSKEAVLLGLIQLFSSIILVYNINLIGTIVMAMRSSDQHLDKKLAIFRRMNDQNPIQPALVGKIHSFIAFQNQIKELFEFNERQALLKELPEQLRTEYNNDVNQNIFRRLPFFRNLRIDSMIALANAFKSRVFYPGEYIVRNKMGIDTIFILKNGKVNLLFQKPGATYMNGVVVDSTEVIVSHYAKCYRPVLLTNTFMNRSRSLNYDIQAEEYSLIMQLNENTLFQILRGCELDRQYFFTIYDKHENSFIFDNQLCNYCPKEYHSKFQCPKLHWMPFKSLIIDAYRIKNSKNNLRYDKYKRNSLRKEHCYYLRKDFFKPYQNTNNLQAQRIMQKLILEFDNKSKEGNMDGEAKGFLEECENIMRRVLSERNLHEGLQEEQTFWGIDSDIPYDFMLYFGENNPSKLSGTALRRKRRKIQRKTTNLSNISTHLLYRNSIKEQKHGDQDYYFKSESQMLATIS